MITYLVLIAVLNTSIGFVLAIYFLPPTALSGIPLRFPTQGFSRLRRPFAREKVATPADAPSELAETVMPDVSASPISDGDDLSDVATDPTEPVTAEPAEPVVLPADEEPPLTALRSAEASVDEQIPNRWLETLEEYGIQVASLVEAAATVLSLEVGDYRDRLARIDSRARKALGSINAGTLRLHLDELQEVNEVWLATQAESASQLSGRVERLGEGSGAAEQLVELLEKQQLQIETTYGHLLEVDINGDPGGSARRMLVVIRNLIDLAHDLRDRVSEMLLGVQKTDDRLIDINRSLMFDSMTKIHNRAGLEKVLQEQFLSNPSRPRQLSGALVDIDRFTELMDKEGPIVCDRLLVAVASLLESLLRQDRGFDLAARYDGQRFFVLYSDTGPHGALSGTERMRQTLEKTVFEHNDHPIELTIRAGVAELKVDETTEHFFDRLEAATDAARLAGRNCTALDDGDGPMKIDGPDYEIAGQRVPLA